MHTKSDKNRLDWIQAIRGIAALLVALFHVRYLFNYEKLSMGDILFGSGAIGVDLFFVISGFIMVYTTKNNTKPIDFISKRIIRIFPVYFVASIAYVLIFNGIESFLDFSFVHYFIKSVFFYDSNPILYVGWSLNYEMYFYLVFGLMLFFRDYSFLFTISFFILSVIIVPIVFQIKFLHPYLNIMVNNRILEFLAGMIIAKIYQLGYRLPKFMSIFLLVISFVFWLYVYFFLKSPNDSFYMWGSSSALLIFSLMMFNSYVSIKVNRILIFFGNISYSMYLWHAIVAGIMFAEFQKQDLIEYNFIFISLFMAVSTLVSYISYLLIEKKICNFLKVNYEKKTNQVQRNNFFAHK